MLGSEPKFDEFASQQTRKYYRIYKTVLEIMDARGYVVLDEFKQMTPAQFTEKLQRQQLRTKGVLFPPLQMQDSDDYDPSIAVYYNFGNEQITQQYIKTAIQAAPKIRKFFLVAASIQKQKGTATLVNKKVQNFIYQLGKKDKDQKQGMKIEIFKEEDLLFNVLKHDLVPKHKVLSDAEKTQLLTKYKVKESQLPKILLTDPVAKFLGLKRGQVVKITRKSETAGTYTTYRIAI